MCASLYVKARWALNVVSRVPRWPLRKSSHEDLVTIRVNLGDGGLLIFNNFIALRG